MFSVFGPAQLENEWKMKTGFMREDIGVAQQRQPVRCRKGNANAARKLRTPLCPSQLLKRFLVQNGEHCSVNVENLVVFQATEQAAYRLPRNTNHVTNFFVG